MNKVHKKISVLYVDDEEHNLTAFRANFRKEYDVHTALSAAEAILFLETNPAQIIIADQRMPETTGVEFLEKTLKLYPQSMRLLISGQSDLEVVVSAINHGQISKFIQKPWDWDKLSLAIDHCATIYNSREELRLMNVELQRTNEELNKFVYSVSHDLRSPLTSILGLVNLTKVKPELKIAESYFEMIEGRVLKLDNFIKKLLDYYRNRRSEDVIENIDFKLLTMAAWNSLKPINSKIKFELISNQDDEFFGDLLRIENIIENLISNAIKYQNPGSANQTISVKVIVNENSARFTISDKGIGIQKKYLENIFQLFFRTENSLQAEGAGIGLYIVKEAVEKIGGKITVMSEVSVGTTFEVVIPKMKSR